MYFDLRRISQTRIIIPRNSNLLKERELYSVFCIIKINLILNDTKGLTKVP